MLTDAVTPISTTPIIRLSAAMSAESTPIPVVSFEQFLTGNRQSQKQVAKQVYDAFSTVGFIYLKDHGIPLARVEEIFELVS